MIRSGFEPETHSLEGCCSIQLSYQTSSECACRKNDACQRPCGDRDSSSYIELAKFDVVCGLWPLWLCLTAIFQRSMRLSQERRLSASLWRPRFLLSHRTHEVRCSLRPLAAMVLPCGKCSKISSLSSAYARKNTHVGTQKGAYKGNLGAKVLLFFELCKYSCKILTKVLQNTFANQVYASHLRCDLPTHHS